MMNTEDLISKINSSTSIIQVFPNLTSFSSLIKDYLLLVHPDKCDLPGANDATIKLLKYKEEFSIGKIHKDDAGTITYKNDNCTITGDSKLIKKSFNNFQFVLKKISPNFKQYFPEKVELLSDNSLYLKFKQRSIPLSSIGDLPQKHLNWVLSRILELSTVLNNLGLSHNGINPDSIYVIPECHGILTVSLYHLTEVNQKLNSVSGRYSSFYPDIIFNDKLTKPYIDIELAKRTVCYLGGDKTGSGSIFKNTHNKDWVDFVSKFDTENTFPVFERYRSLLDKNFKKEFHVLNV